MSYEGLRIRCPLCKRKDFNETTESYNPNVLPTGGMVRLQEKWRKKGMKLFFNDSCFSYQIICGFCGGPLVKAKRLTLADPLPVDDIPEFIATATNPAWNGNPEEMRELVPAVIEEMRASVKSDESEPTEVNVQVENRDGTAVVTATREIPVIDNGPSEELILKYQEFKRTNPESSWRDAWKNVPNDYTDSAAFAYYMRKGLKEMEADE